LKNSSLLPVSVSPKPTLSARQIRKGQRRFYSQGENMKNNDQWCFAWFGLPKTAPGSKTRAALVRDSKWNPGEIITISFLDGNSSVQDRVADVAKAWVGPKMADLIFDFRKDTNTDIRISFNFAGSWSVLGNSCRFVPKSQPTMNYGWLTPDSSDAELKRVVLHEFGHALGLIHEHQNPGGKIKWNRKQVIQDLSGPPNNWTLDVIERNMFKPYAKHETNYSHLDTKSIMMYPIPARWTLDGVSIPLNNTLSATDKKFIKDQYQS
jgi:serralysin